MRPLSLLVLVLALTSCAPSHAAAVQRVSSGGMLYIVATADPATDHIELHWKNPATGQPYRTFEELSRHLAKAGQQVQFMTNSGIYAPGLRPLGLHIEGGQTLVPLNNAGDSGAGGGNFALLPNGVFWIKGKQAGVTETQAYKRLNIAPDYATQSGPLLLSGGKIHPQFNKGSSSFKVRSGVGVCQDGKVRFAVSAGPVNFYSFAVFFRDTLGCPDALYLDGSISAYAAADANTQFADFAGMWTVGR